MKEEIEYMAKRHPIFNVKPVEEWLNEFGKDGWIMCGKRDFNEYIFYKIKN